MVNGFYLKVCSQKPNGGNAKGPAGSKANEEKGEEKKSELEGALEGTIVKEKPNVKWEDIAGLEQAKKSLQENVILPTKFPEIFQGARKPSWKGILLYGVHF
jgi:vacuolar protein-sorting-associated protein 4